MWDYLSVVAPDSSTTLTLSPNRVIVEKGNKNVVIHEGDDGSEERIVLDSDSVFYVDLEWDGLSSSDAGTVFDFYHSTSKGNGVARSFKWDHPTDTHKYTVRFASDVARSISLPELHGFASVTLKVLGRSS